MADNAAALKEANRQRYYYSRPLEWIWAYLGIPPWMFKWSLAGAPQSKGGGGYRIKDASGEAVDPYEGYTWQGTRDPISSMLEGVASGQKHICLYGGNGISKCVREGTWVFTNAGMQRIGDLADPDRTMAPDSYRPLGVPLAARSGVETATEAYRGGRKRVWDVRTTLGFEVGGSDTHRVLVVSGQEGRVGELDWKHCKDLAPGDRVVLRRGAGMYGASDDLTVEDGYALGLLVGDGCYAPCLWEHNTVSLTTTDDEIVTAWHGWLASRGVTPRKIAGREGISDMRAGGVAFMSLLESWGLRPSLSEGKSVPASVLAAPEAVVKAFLRGLFDTDGTVDRLGAVIYATVSPVLAEQVQLLLLNLGIVSRRVSRSTSYTHKGEKRTGQDVWSVSIMGADAGLFRDLVGFGLPRKQARIRKGVTRNTNLDTVPGVPVLARELFAVSQSRATAVRAGRGNKGASSHPLSSAALGARMRASFKTWRLRDIEPSHDSLRTFLDVAAPLADASAYQRMEGLLADGYYFDRVESVTEGEGEVYDVVVPGSRSFVGNGLVNHNTFSGACMALWFLDTRRTSRFVVASPTVKQAKNEGFLSEVNTLVHEFSGPEGSFLTLHPNCKLSENEGYFFVDPERANRRDWCAFVRPLTHRQGETSSSAGHGLHHKNLMILLEEFQGIHDADFTALDKTITGANNHMVVLGNPLGEGDSLQEYSRTLGVLSIHAAPKDHPNVRVGAEIVPACMTREQVWAQAARAAKNLGLTVPLDARGHPDPTLIPDHELAKASNYAVSILGLWPETREDAYLPAGLLLPAKKGLVAEGGEVFRHVFRPRVGVEGALGFPAEGEIRIYKEPEVLVRGAKGEVESIWKRRVVIGMDLAGSFEITPGNEGDLNKNDWHTAVAYDAVSREVLASIWTRGPLYVHILAGLWLCDHFAERYPASGKEAAKPRATWTGRAWPTLAWENAGEGKAVPNLAFLRGKEAKTAGLVAPGALRLPEGEYGWPWPATRSYKGLYKRVGDTSANVSMGSVYGTDTTAQSRPQMLEALLRWAEGIPAKPDRVKCPRLYSELGTFVRKPMTNGGTRVEHAVGAHDDLVFGLMVALKAAEDLQTVKRGPVLHPFPAAERPERQTFREKTAPKKQGFGRGFMSSWRG